ncbi:MAG: hypothetical protein WAW09_03635 [Smithella sp.]
MVGYKTPSNPSDVRLGWELLKLRLQFGRRKIEDLIDMQDRIFFSDVYPALE